MEGPVRPMSVFIIILRCCLNRVKITISKIYLFNLVNIFERKNNDINLMYNKNSFMKILSFFVIFMYMWPPCSKIQYINVDIQIRAHVLFVLEFSTRNEYQLPN